MPECPTCPICLEPYNLKLKSRFPYQICNRDKKPHFLCASCIDHYSRPYCTVMESNSLELFINPDTDDIPERYVLVSTQHLDLITNSLLCPICRGKSNLNQYTGFIHGAKNMDFERWINMNSTPDIISRNRIIYYINFSRNRLMEEIVGIYAENQNQSHILHMKQIFNKTTMSETYKEEIETGIIEELDNYFKPSPEKVKTFLNNMICYFIKRYIMCRRIQRWYRNLLLIRKRTFEFNERAKRRKEIRTEIKGIKRCPLCTRPVGSIDVCQKC